MTPPMNRREAVRATGVVLGALLLTSNGLVLGCAREAAHTTEGVLTANDRALLEDVADTLLPTTRSSPGARAAGAGAAMNLLLTDCYEPEAQVRVVNGLAEFRKTCEARHHAEFAALTPAQREQLLREIDAVALRSKDHYFDLVRELATRAYFSSETGMTKARRYILVPGKWVGCVPLSPGQPAWG